MMRTRRLLRSIGAGFLIGAGILALLPRAGRSQEQVGSEAELRKPFAEVQSQVYRFASGQATPTDADKKGIDIAARWFTQRLTWSGIRESPTQLTKVNDELERLINTATLPNSVKSNRAFVEQFGPALVAAIRPVLDQDLLAGDNRTVLINAATMLPQFARLKEDATGAYLAELLRDPKRHDAIRLYAAKGLREYFPLQVFEAKYRDVKRYEQRKKLDLPRVEALVGYIDGSWQPDAKAMDPNAVRYLRREALETLSQAKVPAVSALKELGKIEGPIAPTLIKVLIGKGLTPEPGLAEKAEAAIGLASMKLAGVPEYKSDLAIYHVGKFLDEFARAYNGDWVNLGGGAAKSKDRKLPILAWKVQSKRVELALKELLANAREVRTSDPDANTRATALDKEARGILNAMQRYEKVEPTNLNALRNAIQKLRPKDGKVFRTLKGAEFELD